MEANNNKTVGETAVETTATVFNGESKISISDMSKVRAAANQSTEKQRNSATKYEHIPADGTFGNVGTKEYKISDEEKVISVGIYTKSGKFISENCLNQQTLLPEFKEIKGGSRKGRVMLRSANLTDLTNFGESADERLIALQGKSFTTEKKPETRVYKTAYLDKVKFDEVCYVDGTENLEEALKKTEVKTGYAFTIS